MSEIEDVYHANVSEILYGCCFCFFGYLFILVMKSVYSSSVFQPTLQI